jgi:hypothetical protein
MSNKVKVLFLFFLLSSVLQAQKLKSKKSDRYVAVDSLDIKK